VYPINYNRITSSSTTISSSSSSLFFDFGSEYFFCYCYSFPFKPIIVCWN